MNSKSLHFDVKGNFRIMQIADTQELPVVSPDTIKLITLAAEKAKPDLVVFTGDQINGISPMFRLGNTEKLVRNTLKQLFTPLCDAEIPFTATFGNHDRQCGISNAQQMEFYKEYPNFVYGSPHDTEDTGTFSLPVYSHDGTEIPFNLYIIDSNGQAPSGEYLPVSLQQLQWYKNERDRIFAENGKYVPSLVFQHIPTDEYFSLLKKVKNGTKEAVEAFRTHKHEYYILPDEIKNTGGFMGESPASPDRNSGEFEAMSEKGDVIGFFVGHDHNNSFAGQIGTIRAGYTQGAGFNVYGPGKNRGVRIFDIDEKAPADFTTHTLTFGELTDAGFSAPIKEFVLTHIPTSMEQVKRLAAVGIISATAMCAAAVCVRKKINK